MPVSSSCPICIIAELYTLNSLLTLNLNAFYTNQGRLSLIFATVTLILLRNIPALALYYPKILAARLKDSISCIVFAVLLSVLCFIWVLS